MDMEVKQVSHVCVRCGERFVSDKDKQFFCHNCRPVPFAIQKQSERKYGRVIA